MKFIVNLLVSALCVLGAAYLLPGVRVDGFLTALGVAIVLGLLNAIVRPILTILTLPITILTLGLFLLVINIIVIKIADGLIAGFEVGGWLWALIFSLVLSVLTAIADAVTGNADD